MDTKQRKTVEDTCKMLSRYHDAIHNLGRRMITNSAILFYIKSTQIDEATFRKKICETHRDMLEGKKSKMEYFILFDEIYNCDMPKNKHVHVADEFMTCKNRTFSARNRD